MGLTESFSEDLSHGQSQEKLYGDVGEAGDWQLKIEFRTSTKESNGRWPRKGSPEQNKEDVGKHHGGTVCPHRGGGENRQSQDIDEVWQEGDATSNGGLKRGEATETLACML